MVDHAIESLGMKPGDSVIDFGCGTGRASAKFRSLGYNVKSIDFAANCVDEGIDLDFIQACLWELPDIKAEYGYCTDVMEHIPPEKVQEVIAGIAARCESAYFNIATRDDCLGGLIGKKLHMTVMDASHWESLLKLYWSDVITIDNEGEATFIVK
jgi:SAM-dependent methyltransferase